MRELNLYKLWEVCNILSLKESELQKQSIFITFMGNRSNYCNPIFEGFVNYYSFRIDGDEIIVFNNDGVPYEDYTNDDFSYVPTVLLSFSPEKLENWMKIEVDLQLEQQKCEKEQQREDIKSQIERLKTRLETL